MFEGADVDAGLSREDYEARAAAVRTGLLELQQKLRGSQTSVVVLINGVEGAGKGDVLNLLHEWLDARRIVTSALGDPTKEESDRPPFWRYVMALPPRGSVGIVLGNWYTRPILARARKGLSKSAFDRELARIRFFEKELADDGTAFVKLWLHISRKDQKRRIKKLLGDPERRWRVTRRDRQLAAMYDTFLPICQHAIAETSTADAPWHVVASADTRHRDVTVGELVLRGIERALEGGVPTHEPIPAPPIGNPRTILDELDLTKTTNEAEYDTKLENLQRELHRLAERVSRKGKSAVVVLEGSDAAGKGGSIRRMIHALDARQYRVVPVAAPTEEERRYHYLWRFWRQLPRAGHLTVFDRSWYGRVLVERVEGFAREPEWRRAYAEINEFEAGLLDHGVVLVKLWLHISLEEQLRRFEERAKTPWKTHKLGSEDVRNREKANQYEAAAGEMIERTSTVRAPWTLVEAEDKRYARIRVLEAVTAALEGAT